MIHNASKKCLAKVNLRNKSPPHLIEEQGRGGTEITKKQCEFYVALQYLCLVSFEGVEVETKMTQGTRTLGQVSRSTLAPREVRREQFSSCAACPHLPQSTPSQTMKRLTSAFMLRSALKIFVWPGGSDSCQDLLMDLSFKILCVQSPSKSDNLPPTNDHMSPI